MVYEFEKLSVAERKRPFYEIDFSPDRLEILYETLKILAGEKTCDMSDVSQVRGRVLQIERLPLKNDLMAALDSEKKSQQRHQSHIS